MKGLCILLVALVGIATAIVGGPVAVSEQSSSQTSVKPSAEEIPFILVELSDSLNAKKLKPGDKVKAQVAQDVLARGRIIIPAEAKLLGHVTEATARSENAESRLGLVFDKILLKHHQELDIRAVVQTVAPPVIKRSRVDEPDSMMPPPVISAQGSSMTPMGGTPGKGSQAPGVGNQPRSTAPVGPSVPDVVTSGGTPPGAPGYRPPASPNPSAQNQSLSVGTRQGVFGLKGLSLSTDTGGPTPGPVIVSKVADVKLGSGTQMLLKILDSTANRP